MIVMNKDGEIFDERRAGDRRLCKRRANDLLQKNVKKEDDRRNNERREKDINKKK